MAFNFHTVEKVVRFIACYNCSKIYSSGNFESCGRYDWCGHPVRMFNYSNFICVKLVLLDYIFVYYILPCHCEESNQVHDVFASQGKLSFV